MVISNQTQSASGALWLSGNEMGRPITTSQKLHCVLAFVQASRDQLYTNTTLAFCCQQKLNEAAAANRNGDCVSALAI